MAHPKCLLSSLKYRKMVLVGVRQPYRKPDAYEMMAVSVPLPEQLAVVVKTGNRVEAGERDVALAVGIRGLSGPVRANTSFVSIDLTSAAVEPVEFQSDAVERVAPPSKVSILRGTFCGQCGAYAHQDFGFVDVDPSWCFFGNSNVNI